MKDEEAQPKEPERQHNYIIEFENTQAPGFCAVNYINNWKIHSDCKDLTVAGRMAQIAENIYHNRPYAYNHSGRILPLLHSFSFPKAPTPRDIALSCIKYFYAPNLLRLADVVNYGMHATISNHLVHGEEITIHDDHQDYTYRWRVTKHEPMRNYNSGNMVMEVDLLRLDSSRYPR